MCYDMLPTVTGYWYFTLSLFTVFSRLACTSNVNQSLFGSKCTNTLYWYNVVAFFPGIRQCQVDPLHLKSAIVPFSFKFGALIGETICGISNRGLSTRKLPFGVRSRTLHTERTLIGNTPFTNWAQETSTRMIPFYPSNTLQRCCTIRVFVS